MICSEREQDPSYITLYRCIGDNLTHQSPSGTMKQEVLVQVLVNLYQEGKGKKGVKLTSHTTTVLLGYYAIATWELFYIIVVMSW